MCNGVKARQKRRFVQRYDGVCFYCGKNLELHPSEFQTRDHVIPKTLGMPLCGNQVLACVHCNRGKSEMIPCRDVILRFIRRWVLHPYKTNAIGEMYDEFFRDQALISVIESWCGEPNIPGVIRADA